MTFKPLLAATLEDPTSLQYPVLVSPKLDGIRTLTHPERGVTSRNLKPIQNKHVRETIEAGLEQMGLHYLDGEVIVGSATDDLAFNKTSSGVMSRAGKPEFTYWVFDQHEHPDQPFAQRIGRLMAEVSHPNIRFLSHQMADNVGELMALEEDYVARGFEGIMIRSMDGKYKYGRSTLNEGILLKLKRWHDMECRIVGFVERLHNGNEAKKDLLGRTERSTHKDNKVPMGTLGSLIVTAEGYSDEFSVGTGFDDALRQEIWDNQDKYLHTQITIKHQPSGAKDAPRFPVFLRFRPEE